MILSEILAQRFNEILGNQYTVYPYHTFFERYTHDRQNQFGGYDINYQAFDENANNILGTVTATEIELISAPYTARAYNYQLNLQVPIEYEDEPKFNFFGDYERLYSAINDKELTFDTLKAFMTMSEPVFMGKDNTGSYKRAVYQITGVITIRDNDVGAGNDVEVAFVIDDDEYYFDNISELSVSSATDANAVQVSGKSGTEQDVAIKSHTVTFAVVDTMTNKAMELLRDKTFKNLEILSPDEENKTLQQKIKTRLYKGEVLMLEFYAVLSTEYSAANKASIGVYRVGLANDEKKEE